MDFQESEELHRLCRGRFNASPTARVDTPRLIWGLVITTQPPQYTRNLPC